ncbi:tRNA 2-thiouridine(34) synthase MnmA [Cloacibacillus porcorum]|uniref:tRNA 2-thiouridine(34) synthase MnmA n=1 Tax=Cloacibacillus porcorum TaxID=1197717 RepID=UPI0023F4B786|nr:tRNA 2-thiouridine(34) synthase MnmA [Cloacibacillus porcorum]MDD7649087.1 tRNA 2-thiouridine(34) synthase MnmA [Cloacibacillus porcorum]MDY4094717.1 tRNA 2-thiouridine(34) synthase MnmA [Cloacibacillus porcorum]
MNGKRALIAMSGGVDSSVAAFLTKEEGFDCTGATMKLFSNEDIGVEGESRCCSLDDVEDARSVANRLGIPFFVFNFSDNFRREVIERFIAAYKSGATPNPCIDCNRFLKFDKFFSRAKELDIGHIVTGHYAAVYYDAASRRWGLKKGTDESKDQSYVLYSLTQEQLAHTLLPLGGMSKTEVREIARDNGFINAKKRESQDICFVPDGDYAAFIERYTGEPNRPGNFVDGEGRVLGRHRGFVRYTIGQRRGLGLSLREPLYVCAKRAADNTVILGRGEELFSKSLTASGINLIACERISSPLRLRAKVRYKQREQWATVEQTAEDRLRVDFDEPQRAVTPGQAVVLYDGSCVVGGGTIE